MAGVVTITNLTGSTLKVIREDIAGGAEYETTSAVLCESPNDAQELAGLVTSGKVQVQLEGRILSAKELIYFDSTFDDLAPIQHSGLTTQVTYDGNDNITLMTELNSDGDTVRTHTLSYNVSGLLSQIVVATYGYDGVLDETVTRTITYDGSSRISSITDEVT